ncbi:hypothetical protein HG531_005116 [Fusarium graminearum]|nr:hypothetical protein HG531_005116 [Fusarium graminearum]
MSKAQASKSSVIRKGVVNMGYHSNFILDNLGTPSFTELREKVTLFWFAVNHLLHSLRKTVAFFSGSAGILSSLFQRLFLSIEALHDMRVPSHEANNIRMSFNPANFGLEKSLVRCSNILDCLLMAEDQLSSAKYGFVPLISNLDHSFARISQRLFVSRSGTFLGF